MSNSIKQSLQLLASWLFANSVVVSKTAKGKGFMIYQPNQVTDLAKLKSLAAAVNWSVKEWPPSFDSRTGASSDASIYVGPRSSANDFATEADFVASLTQE